MKIRLNGERVFCTALSMISLSQCISSSNIDALPGVPAGAIYQMLRLGAFILLAYKIMFKTRYTKERFILSIYLATIAFITKATSQNDYLIIMLMFVIGSFDVDFNEICRTTVISYLVPVCLVMLLSTLGIIPSSTNNIGVNIFTGAVITRQSFGFEHVNMLGGFVLLIYISYLNFRGKAFGLVDFGGSILISVFLFFVANTKTSAFLISILAVLIACDNLWKKIDRKAVYRVCLWIICGSVGLSFFSAVTYNGSNPTFELLDVLLSKRLSFAHSFIEKYGFTLFGQELELISIDQASLLGVSALVLDNAFLHLILRYGIVAFVTVIALYLYIFLYGYRNGDIIMCVSIAVVFISGFSEKWLFMIGYSNLLLSFGSAQLSRLGQNSKRKRWGMI